MRQSTAYEWRGGLLRAQRTPRGGLAYYWRDNRRAPERIAAIHGIALGVSLVDKDVPRTDRLAEALGGQPFAEARTFRLVEAVRADCRRFDALTVGGWHGLKKSPELHSVTVSWHDSMAAGNCYRGSIQWLEKHFGPGTRAANLGDILAVTYDPAALIACAWAAAVFESMKAGDWPGVTV